jgi:hypothetical protein
VDDVDKHFSCIELTDSQLCNCDRDMPI